MKARIQVTKSPSSSEVIREFKTIEELEAANETENWTATQIIVNDCVLMGWDELYDFV